MASNLSPWEDLTQDITFSCEDGSRSFRLREMTRVQTDKLQDALFQGIEEMKAEAAALSERSISTADLIKKAFALQWETLAPALAFILREPIDGGPPPSLDWIRDNLNERRATFLIDAQDKLNGTDKLKKKAAQLAQEAALQQRKAGSSSTIGSLTDTVDGPQRSDNDSRTEKPRF